MIPLHILLTGTFAQAMELQPLQHRRAGRRLERRELLVVQPPARGSPCRALVRADVRWAGRGRAHITRGRATVSREDGGRAVGL